MNFRRFNPLRKLTWHQLDVLQVVINSILVLTSLVTTWYARLDPVLFGICLSMSVFSIWLLARSVIWLRESKEELNKMFAALNQIEEILHQAREREQKNNDNPETKP